MTEHHTAAEFLDACSVDDEVFALRGDYRAMLLVVEGLDPRRCLGAAGASVEALVDDAERSARALLERQPVEQLPHVAAWREAYRGFGAKPQRTRNSLEALVRRAAQGLPRVNALTDIYNAISVLHQVPLGGEDYRAYQGPARLARAAGDEPFDAVAEGRLVVQNPEPGEVVWRDDVGVTCRRWNWRQGQRTALREDTTDAFFIFDALAPVDDGSLSAAADALLEAVGGLGDLEATGRLVGAR
ncbi:B3/4 domain-containing protein [Glutamicibacter endophyticus]